MGLRIILCGFPNNPGRGGGGWEGVGCHEKLIYKSKLPKKGGLGQFSDLRVEAWQKKWVGCF